MKEGDVIGIDHVIGALFHLSRSLVSGQFA